MNSPQMASQGIVQRLLVVLLALGLAAMLATVLVKRVQNPALTEQRAQTQHMPQAAQGGSNIGVLMQRVGEKPDDKDALMDLADALMHAENWQAAETFAQRASVLDVNDPKPLFMLGVILHNLGRHDEAARTLEKVVPLQDSASVRYSLAVLYLYFLDQKDKGIACLKAGLKDPGIDQELKKALEEELQKHMPTQAAPSK